MGIWDKIVDFFTEDVEEEENSIITQEGIDKEVEKEKIICENCKIIIPKEKLSEKCFNCECENTLKVSDIYTKEEKDEQ